jgi:Flp pilus assembly pilin Flp
MQTIPAFIRRQEGQTMAEYAVVLGTIVLACVAIIGLLSSAIVSRFGTVATTIKELLP